MATFKRLMPEPAAGRRRAYPSDLTTVHYYFRKWTAEGTLEAVMGHLRERSRRAGRRSARPTAGSLDSQTVQSVGATAEVGWDGAK